MIKIVINEDKYYVNEKDQSLILRNLTIMGAGTLRNTCYIRFSDGDLEKTTMAEEIKNRDVIHMTNNSTRIIEVLMPDNHKVDLKPNKAITMKIVGTKYRLYWGLVD